MKSKEIRKTIKKGSYTVEAAAVMPVVLLTVFAAIFLCFYAHNKAKLTAAAYEAAISGALEGEMPNADPYGTALYKSQELLRYGYWGLGEISQTVSTGEKVTVIYRGNTSDGIYFRMQLRAQGEYSIWKPTQYVREKLFSGESMYEH